MYAQPFHAFDKELIRAFTPHPQIQMVLVVEIVEHRRFIPRSRPRIDAPEETRNAREVRLESGRHNMLLTIARTINQRPFDTPDRPIDIFEEQP